MKVKEIINGDHKLEVYKMGDNLYDVHIYEYFTVDGWRLLGKDTGYAADGLEDFYGFEI